MKKLASFSRLVFFALVVPQLLSSCTADSEGFRPVAPEQASVLASGEIAYAAQRNVPRPVEQPAPETTTAEVAPPNKSLVAAQRASVSTPASADGDLSDYRISTRDILQIAV